jgi:hypothetical protein
MLLCEIEHQRSLPRDQEGIVNLTGISAESADEVGR